MKKHYIYLSIFTLLILVISCTTNQSSQNSESENPTEEPLTGQSAVVDDVSEKDIVKIAIGSKDHSTLVQAVKAAELVDVLTNAGPFTVFAPTNDAFNKLPEGTLDELLKSENKGQLSDILQYHVTLSTYDQEKLTDGLILNEVTGGSVTIKNKDGKIMVNDANIIASVKASNGIVHVIDKVLLPKPQ